MTEELGRQGVATFATVPDPRGQRGKRHPLAAVLTLATAAMLSGARSLLAITEWGRAQDAAMMRALGFIDWHLAHRVPPAGRGRVEAGLRQWAQTAWNEADTAVAIDGKAVRGTCGEGQPGLVVLAAFTLEAGRVLAQTGGGDRRS